MTTIDPDGPAQIDNGLFGAECPEDQASIVVIPVPVDATTSYGDGTAKAPPAIVDASRQIDLEDRQFGAIYERGIHMRNAPSWIQEANADAHEAARAARKRSDPDAIKRVNEVGERIRAHVQQECASVLDAGRVPIVLGGEHSVPLGLIEEVSRRVGAMPDSGGRGGAGLGILQVDAHMDLRPAYEGFTHSHASVMHNALERCDAITRLVQIGIRDYSRGELEYARAQHGRIAVLFDIDTARKLDRGASFADLCEEAIDPLPHHVHLSVDIDGLDPALCPSTGTPVPGGLSFNQLATLIETLAHAGRTVTSMDLVEVTPGKTEWDASIGARVLYKMCALGRDAK